MTNTELLAKIKAEIERLKAELEKGNYYLDNHEQAIGYESAVLDIECFLDTLESEKPVPADLEEAADNHIRKVVAAAGHPGWDWTTQDIADAFIAGYNLCKEQMLKEAVETYYGYVNNTTQVFLPENKLKGVKEGYVKIIILKDDE